MFITPILATRTVTKALLYGLVALALTSCAVKHSASVPNLQMITIERETIALHDFADQPILIVFWASNCRTCLEEVPEFVRLYSELHALKLAMFAVAMPYDRPDRVVELTQQLNINYPVVLDPLGEINQALGPIELTPTTILIDRQGKVRWQQQGRLNFTALEKEIRAML